MKLDCTDSQYTANASAGFQSFESHHLPIGKLDSEPDAPTGSEVEMYTQVAPPIFIQNGSRSRLFSFRNSGAREVTCT